MAQALEGTPYDLVRPIGKGSMGEVYEGVHRTLGKRRAIKLLAAHLVNRPDLAERMRVEAQLLATIRHPNLVEVIDLGVSTDGRLYFVMDLLEGHTLRGTIEANAPMRPALALELMIPILDGLAAAHAAGVVHRDVKPENVFVLATGEVKVLDFGVAKVGQTAATMTHTSFTAGTPRYMAPEQVDGRPSDPRTDLFACGSLFYELLTARGPFDREERMALAFAILTAEPPPLESAHRISDRVRAIVTRALQKDPRARFESAKEMADEMRACLALEAQGADGRPSAMPQNTVALPQNTVALPPMPPRVPPQSAASLAPISPQSTPPPMIAPSSAVAVTMDKPTSGRGAVVAIIAVAFALSLLALGIGWYAARREEAPRPAAATLSAGSTAALASASPSAIATATASAPLTALPTAAITTTPSAAAPSNALTATLAPSSHGTTRPVASTTSRPTLVPSAIPPVLDAGPRRPGSGL
ncbi:hypothetical protein BH09MYX1_BH09MYX1_54400 [soil metagenome]